MTEIEKLYSLAEVEPQKQCYYWDCPYSTGEVVLDLQKEKDCTNCKNPDKAVFPPFTAEKQLELIKWLAQHNFVVCKNLGGWHTGINPTYDEDFGITCSKRATNFDSFEYAIAGIINNLWQDLTEAEQNEIRRILE